MFCWCWVKILKMKFDQDLCLNLQYDFGKMNSTLGSVVPLAMFEMSLSPANMANSWGPGSRNTQYYISQRAESTLTYLPPVSSSSLFAAYRLLLYLLNDDSKMKRKHMYWNKAWNFIFGCLWLPFSYNCPAKPSSNDTWRRTLAEWGPKNSTLTSWN